jgi:hypothetical protein
MSKVVGGVSTIRPGGVGGLDAGRLRACAPVRLCVKMVGLQMSDLGGAGVFAGTATSISISGMGTAT